MDCSKVFVSNGLKYKLKVFLHFLHQNVMFNEFHSAFGKNHFEKSSKIGIGKNLAKELSRVLLNLLKTHQSRTRPALTTSKTRILKIRIITNTAQYNWWHKNRKQYCCRLQVLETQIIQNLTQFWQSWPSNASLLQTAPALERCNFAEGDSTLLLKAFLIHKQVLHHVRIQRPKMKTKIVFWHSFFQLFLVLYYLASSVINRYRNCGKIL